ncbi:MAG: DUF1572 domain-containing protein [Spirochaetia bacterium]|nr:DUF1572 domain-containing protein [Spirochaetia bacterium]
MSAFFEAYREGTLRVLKQHKDWADKAMAQLQNDSDFFRELGPRSHSVAVTLKHVAGNLRSRWLNFLSSDGEKPDRDRDNEFIILPENTRADLMRRWEEGWKIVLEEIGNLKAEDADKMVLIRSEPHSIPLAIQRSLAHTAYHVGQILYLCRLVKEGDWNWLTIAPGKSQDFNQNMKSQHGK